MTTPRYEHALKAIRARALGDADPALDFFGVGTANMGHDIFFIAQWAFDPLRPPFLPEEKGAGAIPDCTRGLPVGGVSRDTPEPDPIPDAVKANFDTLGRAFDNGAAVILAAVEKATDQTVFLICAVSHSAEDPGEFDLVPFARMLTGNPFEDYLPPTPDELARMEEEQLKPEEQPEEELPEEAMLRANGIAGRFKDIFTPGRAYKGTRIEGTKRLYDVHDDRGHPRMVIARPGTCGYLDRDDGWEIVQ